jgi:indole-3-glycerol phosphate synthase
MILDEIASYTKERVRKIKSDAPLEAIREKALALPGDTGFPFEKALAAPELSFICEIKKASPSKGVIAEDFPYVEIARAYEEAGGAAISVLTEPRYFLGSDAYLKEIAETVTVPILRKDFTIDPYQLYEAKLLGASAVLLICTLLGDEELESYIKLADELGLSALVEAHDESEVEKARRAKARIIGVNNRDLKTFDVDVTNSLRLRKHIPGSILFVSESGISSREDVQRLQQNGTDGILIGEALMRAPDKKSYLRELAGG